jgi:hypothetical protein
VRPTRVALVRVDLQVSLGKVEVALGDDLVECELAAALVFASPAVAEDVFLFWDLNGPGGLATVAVSLVFRHDVGLVDVVVLLCG